MKDKLELLKKVLAQEEKLLGNKRLEFKKWTENCNDNYNNPMGLINYSTDLQRMAIDTAKLEGKVEMIKEIIRYIELELE